MAFYYHADSIYFGFNEIQFELTNEKDYVKRWCHDKLID